MPLPLMNIFLSTDVLLYFLSDSTIEKKTENTSPMQRVPKEQEEKERAKRKQQYAQILSSHLVDIEIQPFESPSRQSITDRPEVSLGVSRSSRNRGVFLPLSISPMEHNFATLSSGKSLAVIRILGKTKTVYLHGSFSPNQIKVELVGRYYGEKDCLHRNLNHLVSHGSPHKRLAGRSLAENNQ